MVCIIGRQSCPSWASKMTDIATADNPLSLERIFQVEGSDTKIRLSAAVWAAFDEACQRDGVLVEVDSPSGIGPACRQS